MTNGSLKYLVNYENFILEQSTPADWTSATVPALALISKDTTAKDTAKTAQKTSVASTGAPTLGGGFTITDSAGTTDLQAIAAKSIGGRPAITLTPGLGKGVVFGPEQTTKYKKLKTSTNVYWSVADCTSGQIVAQSQNAQKNVYGASVPKIIIAAAALHNNGGRPNGKTLGTIEAEWKNMINLIVKSENDPAWTNTQNVAGGAAGVAKFCAELGYTTMQPAKPGGQINATELSKFYIDLVKGRFKGADAILKISHACATSSSRSKVYIPAGTQMGGKTGTWKSYNHDTGWLVYNGQFWTISVLTDGGLASDDIATMWGGIFKEFIQKVKL